MVIVVCFTAASIVYCFPFVFTRLLGRCEVSLGDVMARGQYSKAVPLKGKKGDQLKVEKSTRLLNIQPYGTYMYMYIYILHIVMYSVL